LDFRQTGVKKLGPQPNLPALSNNDKNDTSSRLILLWLEASVGPGGRMGWSYKSPPEWMGTQRVDASVVDYITTAPDIPRQGTRSLTLLVLWEI
jgi:hypothetical protein